LRIGDDRVNVMDDGDETTALDVGHRRDIYKRN